MSRTIELNKEWLSLLEDEFDLPYMGDLSQFLRLEQAAGKIIYPAGNNIFAALNTTPLSQVKVVILGQDPYHGPNQAHGLSFSVPKGVVIPPSLKNIYKEIKNEFGEKPPTHGNLITWANQGVLLLNSVLTVEHSKAASHQGKGWEQFTDQVIKIISNERQNIVFLLWGAYAQKKGQSIDKSKHLVLSAPHPSPLSAHRGFLGCQHFSKTNDYLQSSNQIPIDWQIS